MTVAAVTTIGNMARWQPNARGRLRQAALELYGDRGFDQTTVAQIAERAGLTERTFYRHFADKREVVFSGEVERVLRSALADAPASATPIEAVTAALDAAGDVLDERHAMTRRRQAVIAANPSLQEREQIKYASLAEDMAALLRERGADRASARLAADAGIAVFRAAFERWIDAEERRDFHHLVRETLDELRSVVAAGERPVQGA
jgi:AcrR family transcriptional regulator